MSKRLSMRTEPCPTCGADRRVTDGAALRTLREKAGITLRVTAKRMGISAMYLCDMERNRRTFTEAMVTKFLAAIGGRV